MFKLIALKPLQGCRKSALKCLEEGSMYYFCNEYTITEDGIMLRDDYVRPLPEDFFSVGERSSLQINISAIVGMNGDGKSTLVELIAYIDIGNVLIDNNCCERAVRPFTNLRKSFGGFSSELGGEVAAAWLTFVESCKIQKKAALEVFNGYFQRIAQGRRDYDLITEEVLC